MRELAKFALAPRWLALHVFIGAACVTMVLLGRWQLRVSNAEGFSLQNSAYAVQWWGFALFAIFLWIRILRDAQRQEVSEVCAANAAMGVARESPSTASVTKYVMPGNWASTIAAGPEHLAYNDYLSRLAGEDARHKAGRRMTTAKQVPPVVRPNYAPQLVGYRIMAFTTGTILIIATIAIILKDVAHVHHMEPETGLLWLAHGWLFLVYVLNTLFLGLKLRWRFQRILLIMAAGTIPTMSFLAEHFVMKGIKQCETLPT